MQEVLPFVLGKAIIVGFENQIRFGREILSFNDPQMAQVFQFIYIELVGFKVDQIYILNWLKKYMIKDPSLDLDVLKYIQNKSGFIK